VLTVRNDQIAAMSCPNRTNVAPCPDTATWIEIELLDDDGQPVAGAEYKIKLPDGSIHKGTLDGNGLARYDGIVPGQCSVTFPPPQTLPRKGDTGETVG